MKNVVLLGSTGSIGTSTVKVAEDLPDHIRLVGLAAGNNAELLLKQTQKHRPEAISINNYAKSRELEKSLGAATQVYAGDEGLINLATLPSADIVLIAIVGTAGLKPALAAIRAGKDIAIASKEILVMAGEIVMNEASKHGVHVLAVDSEHSAIFQCLDGNPRIRPQTLAHGVRRAVSHHAQGGISQHHRRKRAQTSVVGHGPEKSPLIRRRCSTRGWK